MAREPERSKLAGGMRRKACPGPPPPGTVRVPERRETMKEYRTIAIETKQGWGGAKGAADTEAIDAALNRMARDGWELVCLQDLQHTAGSGSLLCVFARERQP